MTVSYQTAPQYTNLLTLAEAKTHLRVTGSSQDDLISSLVADASDEIARRLGRYLARAQYSEDFPATGKRKRLGVMPLARLDSFSLNGTSVDVSGFSIVDARRSLVERHLRAFQCVDDVPVPWNAVYHAGWVVPDDDAEGETDISFDGPSQTITRSTGFPPLVEGDLVAVSGATNSENNGSFLIESATSTEITLPTGSGLVTEAAGATVSIAISTVPGAVRTAAKLLISSVYHSVGSDPSVLEQRFGQLWIRRGAISTAQETVNQKVDTLLTPFQTPKAISSMTHRM